MSGERNIMKKVFIVIVIVLFSGKVFAYTECPGLSLTRTHLDVDGNFFIATGAYLNGMIPNTSTNFSQSIAIALTGRTTGQLLTIRYSNDGVVCGSAAWNEIIIGIGL